MIITKKTVREVSRFCCGTMREAVEAKAIDLPVLKPETNQQAKAQIFGPFKHRQTHESFEIHHCPFCGEKIQFSEL